MWSALTIGFMMTLPGVTVMSSMTSTPTTSYSSPSPSAMPRYPVGGAENIQCSFVTHHEGTVTPKAQCVQV